TRKTGPSEAGRTTNPFTRTIAPASVVPVTFTEPEVVSDGSGSTSRTGAIESLVTKKVEVARFPARSSASIVTVFEPSTRGTTIKKEPSPRTQARRPSTVTTTVLGSYVSVDDTDSAIRPRISAMSEFVGLGGEVNVILGATESRTIVIVATG